jgi:hypothetical protein
VNAVTETTRGWLVLMVIAVLVAIILGLSLTLMRSESGDVQACYDQAVAPEQVDACTAMFE